MWEVTVSRLEEVRGVIEPLFADLESRDSASGTVPAEALSNVEIVDIERGRGVLRITLDRPGGIDLETISVASRLISEALDRHDPLPGGAYTLEVSSPGIERPLRTPEHFRRFIGSTVAVKTRPDVEGERRFQGVISDADDHAVVVDDRRVSYGDIETAHTVFDWAQSSGKSGARSNSGRKKASA